MTDKKTHKIEAMEVLFKDSFKYLASLINETAIEKGWWKGGHKTTPRHKSCRRVGHE